MKKIALIIAIAVLAAACAPQAEPAPVAEAVVDAALSMSGKLEKAWSLEDLQALPATSADFTNKDGETTTYSGVSFADLFESASVSDYASVNLIAADDYSIEVDQATLAACADCIIAIEDDGALRSVMPGMEGMFQVKDLVALEIK